MAWIYQTGSPGEARIKVAEVGSPGQADLCVYLVSTVGLAAGDERWYIDSCKESARTWICFTGIGFADVKVCFVRDRGMAGWNVVHRLQGKFR